MGLCNSAHVQLQAAEIRLLIVASILISGPAGGGKSQAAREILEDNSGPTVAADFQAIVAALLLLDRDPVTGLYPIRPTWVLPLAEYVRQAAVTGAVNRDIDVVATNSDGDPSRRQTLLSRLGSGATEMVVDPGEDVVRARLSDLTTGEVGTDCEAAIQRWYRRR